MSFVAVAAAVVGVTGIVVGAVQTGKANKRIKNAMNQRKAFKTPDEVFQLLNSAQSKAQGDTITRDFQQNQLDMGFADALSTAENLGAGPNSLSSLFGKKIQGQLQIGEDFHRSNMEAWGNYAKALAIVGENKAAEQASQDNIWKDYMQSLAKQKVDANATLNNGINTTIGAAAAYGTAHGNYGKKDKTDTSELGSFGGAGGDSSAGMGG